ncbi:MAG: carbon monoxide dehydrogenase, partial [Candidatus Hydrothermarchaeales archaeon]
NTFLRALLRHMVVKRGEYIILDTEAGLEHIGRGIAKKFDLMAVIVEPSLKAIEAANRIYDLSLEMGIQRIYAVGNKVNSEKQIEYIKNKLKFEPLGFIPFDEAVIEADMQDTTIWGNDSKALNAIVDISEKIAEIK